MSTTRGRRRAPVEAKYLNNQTTSINKKKQIATVLTYEIKIHDDRWRSVGKQSQLAVIHRFCG